MSELRAALLRIFDAAVDRPDIREVAREALAAAPPTPEPGIDEEQLAEAIRPLFDGPEPVSLERLGWWDGDLLALTRVEIAKRIAARLTSEEKPELPPAT